MEGLHIAVAAMTGPQMKEIVSFVQEHKGWPHTWQLAEDPKGNKLVGERVIEWNNYKFEVTAYVYPTNILLDMKVFKNGKRIRPLTKSIPGDNYTKQVRSHLRKSCKDDLLAAKGKLQWHC